MYKEATSSDVAAVMSDSRYRPMAMIAVPRTGKIL